MEVEGQERREEMGAKTEEGQTSTGEAYLDATNSLFLTELEKQRESPSTYRDYYSQLTAKISLLDSRFKDSLRLHEKDFLTAFKSHMFQVYQEVNDLKKKTDEQELKIKRDEQLNKLQSSLDWFREEAVHLAETCHFYKKECERWKAKADSAADDRKLLEIQLQAAKKQIKDLVAAVDRGTAASPCTVQDAGLPVLGTLHKLDLPSTASGNFLLHLYSKCPPTHPRFLAEIERFMSAQEAKFQESIRHLQHTIDTDRRKTQFANAAKSSVILEKSEFEALFLECVDEVRKDVMRRRANSVMKTKYTHKTHSSTTEKKDPFTPGDKRRILELLITNEPVLVFLYEKLFPYRANVHTNTQRLTPIKPPPDISDLMDFSSGELEKHHRTASEAPPLPPGHPPNPLSYTHRARTLVLHH